MFASNSYRALFLAAASVGLASSPAVGALMVYTNPNSLPASWPASQAVVGSALPVIVSGSGGAAGSPNTVQVSETFTPGKIEAETFTATSTFNLGAISFVMSGNPDSGTNDASIQLFNLSSVPGAGTTTSSYTLGGAGGEEVGSELLGGGAGLSFTYAGGANNSITEFDFTGSDQVQIQAGKIYSIEIWDGGAGPTFFVGRTISGPYSGGQIYVDHMFDAGGEVDMSTEPRTNLNGVLPRNFLFAVYPTAAVPEPASVGLMMVGAVGLLGRRRGRAGGPQ